MSWLTWQWVEDSRPAFAEQVKVALTFNAVRLTYGLELADFLPPPATTMVVLPTAPPSAPNQGPTSATVKVKLSQVIDQGSDQEITLLDHSTLSRYRARFNELNGDSPLQKVEVTDGQLTALDFRVNVGQTPYANFGVWGPYGARLERRLKFNPSHDGTRRHVEDG